MTPNGTSSDNGSGGGLWAPPLLFVLALGILFEGGDWPPATFLIRVIPFVLAALFVLRRDAVVVRPNAVDLLVCALWLYEAALLARADYRWVSYQWFLHHSAVLALYLVLRAQPGPGNRFPGAAGFLIIAAAALEALVAVYQRFVAGIPRPAGTLANPNFMAEVLVYGGVAACCVLDRREPGRRRWLLPLVALFAGGIVLAGSRGGVLVGLAVLFPLMAGRFGWKRTLAGAGVAAAVLLVASGTLLERFAGKGDPYAFERLNMWKAALRIFADHPLGVGTGHFKYFWPAVRDPVEGSLIRFARFAATPHNELFSILSELGLPGAAAFLGLGAAGFVGLRRAVRAADPAATGAATILFASFVHSFFQTNYHIIGLLLVNGAALAVVSGRLFLPAWSREIRVKGILRHAVLALLAVMAVYSGMTLAGTLLDGRGNAALREGRLREAGSRFLQAAAADPWQAAFPDSASAALYRLHESEGGAEHLSRAIESEVDAVIRNPLEFRYRARLGFLYLAAADRFGDPAKGRILEASLDAYEKAIMLNPHSAEIRYQKAVALRAAGRGGESRRLIGEVLSEEPRYARGWVFLGEALEGVDGPGAAAAYAKALELYYTYGNTSANPDEREFLSLDVKAVERRARELGAGRER